MSKTYLATLGQDNKLTESQRPTSVWRGGKAPQDDYYDVWVDTGPDYLCFTAEQANSTVAMTKSGSPTNTLNLQYSFDKTNWVDFVPAETTITLTNVGDKVWMKGNNEYINYSNGVYYRYTMTGKIAASGDITSMLDETMEKDSVSNYCYARIFQNCTSLTTAPELPATKLAIGCYYCVFYGCTSLTSAPKLPATTLAQSCYSGMFSNCTGLIQAPELPAMTLASSCYEYMFYGCTSLTSAPELPATTLTGNCYEYMFRGCTSLTTLPRLQAKTLVGYCYQYMFQNCTSLKLSTTQDDTYKYTYRIPTEGTGTTASNAFNDMFGNTGGPFRGAPSINTTYYTDHEPI